MTTITLTDAAVVGERALTSELGAADELGAIGSTSRRGLSLAARLLRPLLSAGISVVVVLGLWLGFIYILNLNPLVAKSPVDVARFFIDGGAKGQPASDVWNALGQTIKDAGIGLIAGLIAAIAIALVFVTMRAVEQSFLPLAIVVRSVPLVAMTPLITLVCGRGLFGVTVITGLVVFFPALVTMTFGLRSASRQAADLCRAYGGGSWIIVRKVMLPSSLPAMFASARVAVPTSLIGALLAELLASGKGIGYAITQEENVFSYDSLWASVTIITLLSVLAYYAVQAVENIVLARFGPAPRGPVTAPAQVDLLVRDATLVATCDDNGRELAGGWIAVTKGLVAAVGTSSDVPPQAHDTIDAAGCLVTPGLINTHHHIFQNLTRAFAPVVNGTLFEWLTGLYPVWSGIDEEASYLAAWVGLAELALGGCTTTTDHLYIRPEHGGDLWSAEIAAARELGMRFHPTRGSMSLSVKDGGLPPDSVVQDEDEILADSERLVQAHHDPAWGAMVRIALAPCSPFSVAPSLMRRTAQLAERLDVRLHTHLAEDPDETPYCLEKWGMRPIDFFDDVGWMTNRSWVAHCIYPSDAEIARLGAAGVGVAHCPSSNMVIGGGGFAPVREYRAAGVPVGLACDGSASNDLASLWMESRTALLLGRQRKGAKGMTAREVLDMGTRGSAACLGRAGEIGQLSVGAVGDLVVWPMTGLQFAGAHTDPIEAWLRCGPNAARDTIVAGRRVVAGGELVASGAEEILTRHSAVSRRLQGLLA